MQRRTVLATGAVLLAAVAFVAVRSVISHQAAHAVDQGLNQLVATLPPGYAVRHGAVAANPITSALTLRDVVVTKDGATLATAGTLTVSGADRQALQDVIDPASYKNGQPAWTDRRLLIADASADDVHVILPGIPPDDLTIRAVSLHRLSGRPFMMPPTPENRARPQFWADVALALRMDTLQGRDLAAVSQAGARTVVRVGSDTVSDYDGGKVGSLAVKEVTLDGDGKPRGKPLHATASAFNLKNLDLRGALEAVRQSGRASQGRLGKTGYDSGDLSGVSMRIEGGPQVSLHDAHVSQAMSDTGPSVGQGWLHGLTFALGQTPVPAGNAAALAAFGMTALTMDIDAATSMDKASRSGDVREAIVLRDLATLHVQGAFSGFDNALASPSQPLAAVLATTIDHASVVFEDHSLIGRLIAVAAAQSHTTPDMVRSQLAMPVVSLGLMLPDQPDASDQLTNFINHPGTLTIAITPPQKVTIADIAQAPLPERAHLLGVHITSKVQ